jgi:hypothetical protein
MVSMLASSAIDMVSMLASSAIDMVTSILCIYIRQSYWHGRIS